MIIFSQACSPAYFKQQKSTEKSTHATPSLSFAACFANLECPDFLFRSGSPLKERLTVSYLNPLYYPEM